MVIRAAETQDVDQFVTIRNTVVADDPIDADDVRSLISQALDLQLFAAFDGDHAVAVAGCALFQQRFQAHTEVWVPREHRRRGAGSALYEAISHWAAKQGRDELEV